jgi:hypothetical protein
VVIFHLKVVNRQSRNTHEAILFPRADKDCLACRRASLNRACPHRQAMSGVCKGNAGGELSLSYSYKLRPSRLSIGVAPFTSSVPAR